MNTWQDSRNAAKCQNNPGSWRPDKIYQQRGDFT